MTQCVSGIEKIRITKDGKLTDLWEIYETTWCEDGSIKRVKIGVVSDD